MPSKNTKAKARRDRWKVKREMAKIDKYLQHEKEQAIKDKRIARGRSVEKRTAQAKGHRMAALSGVWL